MKHRKTKPAVALARLMRATGTGGTYDTAKPLPPLRLDRYWKVSP